MFRLWRLTKTVAAGLHRRRDALPPFLRAPACLLLAGLFALSAAGSAHGGPAAAGFAAPSPVAAGKTDCDRNRDFYARLQARRGPRGACPGNPAWTDSCCAQDDGVCSGSCDARDDNDCLILESLIRSHEFLAAGKSAQGFTPDARGPLFKVRSEYYRLVPCTQAVGYMNLYRHTGRLAFLKEATDRLDFLAANLGTARSGRSYDGQLGWAFLDGYQLTCDDRYLEIGLELARTSNPYESRVLNWGMLAAINELKAHGIAGDSSFLPEAREILAKTLVYQNEDGSFPHQDDSGRRSLPYTSWLAHELCRYRDLDPGAPGLARAIDDCAVLFARQTSANGSPAYEYDSLVVLRVPDPMCLLCSRMEVEGCSDYCPELCSSRPGLPSCWCIVNPEKECPYVDTLVNVSYYDEEDKAYDVRGWTSELPSTAFVLSRTGRMEAKQKVLSFLLSLQNQDGSYPDKWGFVPNPNSSMWAFSSDSHSVIRTSCVFFYLSELLNSESPRKGGLSAYDLAEVQAPAGGGAVAPSPHGALDASASVAAVGASGREGTGPVVSVRPSPSFGRVLVEFDAGSGPADIVVVSADGRLVRRLAGGLPGSGVVLWDGRDEGGRPAAPGIYFVTLRSGRAAVSSKFVLLRSE